MANTIRSLQQRLERLHRAATSGAQPSCDEDEAGVELWDLTNDSATAALLLTPSLPEEQQAHGIYLFDGSMSGLAALSDVLDVAMVRSRRWPQICTAWLWMSCSTVDHESLGR